MGLTIVIAVICVVLLLYIGSRKPANFPPGPVRLPFIGTLWRTHLDLRVSMMERHINMAKIYGKIVGFFVLNHPAVTINDYEIAKEVFGKIEAAGRPLLDYTKMRTHGKLRGVLLNEGEVWLEQRRFSLHHLRDLGMGRSSLEDVIQHQVTELLKRLHQLTPGHSITVNSFFNVHVLNVLWEIVTGKQFRHDDASIQIIINYLQLFLRSTSDLGGILHAFAGSLWKPLGGSLYKSIERGRDDLDRLFRKQIEEHRASLDPKSPRDFMDHLLIQSDLESTKNDGVSAFHEWELFALLQDLFLAGSETTSTNMEWTVLYMLTYPEVQSKVQAELDAVVGPGQRVEMSHRSQLPFTEAALAETFRCSNLLPQSVPHRAMKKIEVAGYTIPEDTWINVNLHAIHQQKSYWGDPENFRPERFIKEGKFVPDKHLVPFGIGKRICMGEALARQESFLFNANVLHSFSIRPPDGRESPDVVPTAGLVVAPVPFNVQFLPRH